MTKKDDAVEVVKKSRKIISEGNVSADNTKLEAQTLIAKNKALIAAHARSEAARGLLEMLPQGPGSGLDADTVDGLHAAEIIAKAAIRGTGSVGGGSTSGKIITTYGFGSLGNLEVGVDLVTPLLIACSLTIIKVKAIVKTAPTGQAIIIDVNKNGTSIFTNQANRPQIAAGETTGESGTPDITTLAENDVLTFDIDQVGSGTPGADLSVILVCEQTVVME